MITSGLTIVARISVQDSVKASTKDKSFPQYSISKEVSSEILNENLKARQRNFNKGLKWIMSLTKKQENCENFHFFRKFRNEWEEDI